MAGGPTRPAIRGPPLCSDYIGQTALSMRSLQLYAPKVHKAAYDQSVQLAAAWMAKAQPKNNDDRGWRLLGLAWAGKDKDATQKAMRELLAKQRADGGWSDLDSMESGAYATGKALVALQAAGLATTDAAYERGVQYLLKTQQEDGSWYVKTRALAFQPYFDSGFPLRFRSVDFRRGHKLGDDGALAGVTGGDDDRFGAALADSLGNGGLRFRIDEKRSAAQPACALSTLRRQPRAGDASRGQGVLRSGNAPGRSHKSLLLRPEGVLVDVLGDFAADLAAGLQRVPPMQAGPHPGIVNLVQE